MQYAPLDTMIAIPPHIDRLDVKYPVQQRAPKFRIQLFDTVYNTPIAKAVGEILSDQFSIEAITDTDGILNYESTQ